MGEAHNTMLLDTLLYLILVVKIIWILSMFTHFIIKKYFHSVYDDMLVIVKEVSHDIFTVLIGLLLIYLYHNLSPAKVCISGRSKEYLFSFGILACIGVIQKTLHQLHFD